MPRPSQDRVMVSFWVARSDKERVEQIAANTGKPKSEVWREAVRRGLGRK